LKILFFAFDFPPSTNVGAKRTFSFYNTLIESNHDVIVVSNEILYSSFPKVSKNFFISLKIAPYFRSIDSSIFSRYFSKSFKNILFRKFPKVDIVLVSYKPIASIYLGIFYKLFYGTKLIVDLRDLISLQGHKNQILLVHFIDVIVDKILLSFADEIITVTPTCKEKADNLYKRDTHLIYNGFDFIRDSNSTDGDINRSSINILYSGSLNETRRLDKIYEYVCLINKKIKCQLVVASKQNPFSFGARPEFTNWLGFISSSDLITLISNVDFFFLVEGNTISAKENIPAKVYEYISFRKPVLIDCYKYSDAVKLLEDLEVGIIVEDFQDFEKAITIHQFNLNADISQFSRLNQNFKLLKVIENI
jgi:hypothetical protein